LASFGEGDISFTAAAFSWQAGRAGRLAKGEQRTQPLQGCLRFVLSRVCVPYTRLMHPPPKIRKSNKRPFHSRKAVRIAVIFLAGVAVVVLAFAVLR
jgi:hypothetical protein